MILVGSTVAAYKCDGNHELRWLAHAEEWQRQGAAFFCAVQTGHGHDGRLRRLRERLSAIGATVWEFSLDEGAASIDRNNRLTSICTGRNLIHEHLNRHVAYTHLLLLDTDVRPPANCLERLLEVERPVVAGRIPIYDASAPGWGVEGDLPLRQMEWAPAGCLLLVREAAVALRWRWSLDEGLTDDPCFGRDAWRAGFGVCQRTDVICRHWPEALYAVEARGHDLSIVR